MNQVYNSLNINRIIFLLQEFEQCIPCYTIFLLPVLFFFSSFFSGSFQARDIIYIYFNANLMLLFYFLTEVLKTNISKKNTIHT